MYAAAESLQSCLILCDPMDCSPPDSSVCGNSPGKNSGVGCHALLQRIFPTQKMNLHLLRLLHWLVGSLPLGHLVQFSSVAQSCPTLCNPMDCSPLGSSDDGDSPGKNSGVGCHALLERIFPIQRSNPVLPHCKQILYHMNHQGSPHCNVFYIKSKRIHLPMQESWV